MSYHTCWVSWDLLLKKLCVAFHKNEMLASVSILVQVFENGPLGSYAG
jgi:hypothetical protein